MSIVSISEAIFIIMKNNSDTNLIDILERYMNSSNKKIDWFKKN